MNWTSNATARPLGPETAGEDEPSTNGHGSEPLSLHPDPSYPLLLDPDQVIGAERFSVLRTRLLNAQAKSGVRAVMITSPQKGEGKSLVCMNLALSLAQLERQRILLVDGDLRVKGVTTTLGMQADLGVADFLQGRASFEDSIRSTSSPYLFVAGAGQVSEECLPAVLEGSKWPEFLEVAKQQFNMVVIDSVPVAAPIADLELLSAPCDAVLLIVHLRKTTREALSRTMERMDKKLLGIVINNIDPREGREYSYYAYRKKK